MKEFKIMKQAAEETVPYDYEPKYDFRDIHNIAKALDFLRKEAKKTNNDDLVILINSAFNICFLVFHMSMRLADSSEK